MGSRHVRLSEPSNAGELGGQNAQSQKSQVMQILESKWDTLFREYAYHNINDAPSISLSQVVWWRIARLTARSTIAGLRPRYS